MGLSARRKKSFGGNSLEGMGKGVCSRADVGGKQVGKGGGREDWKNWSTKKKSWEGGE